jgi:hypothetical protein
VFTAGRNVVAVASVTELSDGRLNIAVVTPERGWMRPGVWSWAESEEVATAWAFQLLEGDFRPSCWQEGMIVP